MDFLVSPEGPEFRLSAAGFAMRCAVGRSGFSAAKREGDGATPLGRFIFRPGYYRADRIPKPASRLALTPIAPDDLWCDAPEHAAYNRLVKAPFAASHEEMWRADGLYDIVVPLGYNDDPPVPFLGSAIFFHLSHRDYAPTAGCIAVPLEDMLKVLALASAASVMEIRAEPRHG